MRVGGSNSKGASFERKVCVQLSLWVTGGLKSDCFWRSSMSGGRATVAFKRGTRFDRQAGDICAISPEGHALTDCYFLECKHRRDVGLEAFLLNERGPLAKWWKIACAEARKYNRSPVLIAKGNRTPTLVITRRSNTRFNPAPVVLARKCVIGLFEHTLKTTWRMK